MNSTHSHPQGGTLDVAIPTLPQRSNFPELLLDGAHALSGH